MSVTFTIRGDARCDDLDCALCGARWLNISNVNAIDVLADLGIEPSCAGTVAARELAGLCRVMLADTACIDPGLPVQKLESGRVIFLGRRPGYLGQRARELLELATLAGDLGWITWA